MEKRGRPKGKIPFLNAVETEYLREGAAATAKTAKINGEIRTVVPPFVATERWKTNIQHSNRRMLDRNLRKKGNKYFNAVFSEDALLLLRFTRFRFSRKVILGLIDYYLSKTVLGKVDDERAAIAQFLQKRSHSNIENFVAGVQSNQKKLAYLQKRINLLDEGVVREAILFYLEQHSIDIWKIIRRPPIKPKDQYQEIALEPMLILSFTRALANSPKKEVDSFCKTAKKFAALKQLVIRFPHITKSNIERHFLDRGHGEIQRNLSRQKYQVGIAKQMLTATGLIIRDKNGRKQFSEEFDFFWNNVRSGKASLF